MSALDSNVVFASALAYARAALSIIPIHADGSKAPTILWHEFQTRRPTEQEIEAWFAKANTGIGIVCGAVSGGLEVLDFDAPGMYEAWLEEIRTQIPAVVPFFPIVKTPSEGHYQVYLKRPHPEAGKKLASRRQGDDKIQVLIETRGEGNYVLAPGSPPECHSTGKTYEHISGPRIEEFAELAFLDDGAYQALITAARALNEYVPLDHASHHPGNGSAGPSGRPGDDFNLNATWKEILEPHKWNSIRTRGSVQYWQRPGKDGPGISATTGHCSSPTSGDLLYVFSTNAHPFENGRAYGKFSAYTLLNHHGNCEEAAAALAAKGFGHAAGMVAPSGNLSAPRIGAPLLWRPFPVEVLPEPVRSYVIDGAKALGCDPAYIALPMLAALASAIGATRCLQLKTTWKVPSIAWPVVVSESGTMKSPALDMALSALRAEEDQTLRAFQSQLQEYEQRKLVYDADLSRWKHERSANRPPPPKPAEPILTRYTVSDITIEALAPLLLQNPRGLLLGRDELAGWIGSFDAFKHSKGTDVAQWLELHRGGRIVVDRKTGPSKTIYVARAVVSVCGTIQPGTLRKALTPDFFDNGLAARLLFAMPPRKPKKWSEATVGKDLEGDVRAVFRDLLHLDFQTGNNGLDPVLLNLEKDAKDQWIDFYNTHAQAQAEAEGSMAAALSKLEEYAARFALIFHLTRRAFEGRGLEKESAVNSRSMADGITLTQWSTHEVHRIYALFAESPEEGKQRRLIEYIQGRGGSITVRDLTHGPQEYRGEGGANKAESDLKALVKAGVASTEMRKPGGAGRPVEVFILKASPRDFRIVEPEPQIASEDFKSPISPPDDRIVEPVEPSDQQKERDFAQTEQPADFGKNYQTWGEL